MRPYSSSLPVGDTRFARLVNSAIGGWESMRIFLQFFSWACAVGLGAAGLLVVADGVRRNASRSEGRITRAVAVRSEFQVIFAPQALIEFARSHPAIEDHEELSLLLGEQNLDELWYACVALNLLSTGERNQSVNYVYPARMPHVFPNVKAVLETLRGDVRTHSSNDYSKARISILSDENLRLGPQAVLADLVERHR